LLTKVQQKKLAPLDLHSCGNTAPLEFVIKNTIMDNTEFWNWFKSVNTDFIDFYSKNILEQENILDLITEKLHEYSEEIYPLLSSKKNENTLIITAHGVSFYFDEIEELINSATEIENWTLIAFSPKIEFDNLDYEDIRINKSDLKFIPWEFPDEPTTIAFYLYINDFENKSKSEWLSLAIEKCLVMLLGEKKYGDNVQFYKTKDLNEVDNAFPIEELEDYVNRKIQEKNNSI